jgi:outer membrane receptor protein involved in Fe transport
LGAIVDINLGVEYRYNTRVSAFLQINNLASQQYYRWYNYPVQPIQVMAGVTARF